MSFDHTPAQWRAFIASADALIAQLRAELRVARNEGDCLANEIARIERKTIDALLSAARARLQLLPYGEACSKERVMHVACREAIDELVRAKRKLIALDLLPIGVFTSDRRPDGTADVKLDPDGTVLP